MGYWKDLLPANSVKYLLLTRQALQAWVSCTLRRQIQTFGHMRRYNASIESSLRGFLANQGTSHLHVVYEDILLRPERELARLSEFLQVPVTMDDLLAVHSGRFYRKNRGAKDFLKATLIHIKNYSERLR
jgi:hypothetical protein